MTAPGTGGPPSSAGDLGAHFNAALALQQGLPPPLLAHHAALGPLHPSPFPPGAPAPLGPLPPPPPAPHGGQDAASQQQPDKVQICYDFTKGTCTRGDKCKYSHDIATIVHFNSREKGICFDYLRNQCHRGLLCRFSHDLSNIAQQCQANNAASAVAPTTAASTAAPTAACAAPGPGPPQRRATSICYDFVKGVCQRGGDCRYSHDLSMIARTARGGPAAGAAAAGAPQPQAGPTEVCYDFLRGRCSRGNSCKYSHQVGVFNPAAGPLAPTQPGVAAVAAAAAQLGLNAALGQAAGRLGGGGGVRPMGLPFGGEALQMGGDAAGVPSTMGMHVPPAGMFGQQQQQQQGGGGMPDAMSAATADKQLSGLIAAMAQHHHNHQQQQAYAAAMHMHHHQQQQQQQQMHSHMQQQQQYAHPPPQQHAPLPPRSERPSFSGLIPGVDGAEPSNAGSMLPPRPPSGFGAYGGASEQLQQQGGQQQQQGPFYEAQRRSEAGPMPSAFGGRGPPGGGPYDQQQHQEQQQCMARAYSAPTEGVVAPDVLGAFVASAPRHSVSGAALSAEGMQHAQHGMLPPPAFAQQQQQQPHHPQLYATQYCDGRRQDQTATLPVDIPTAKRAVGAASAVGAAPPAPGGYEAGAAAGAQGEQQMGGQDAFLGLDRAGSGSLPCNLLPLLKEIWKR